MRVCFGVTSPRGLVSLGGLSVSRTLSCEGLPNVRIGLAAAAVMPERDGGKGRLRDHLVPPKLPIYRPEPQKRLSFACRPGRATYLFVAGVFWPGFLAKPTR